MQEPELYEFVASRQLPSLDPTATVKRVVLNDKQLEIYNAFIRRIQPCIAPLFLVSFTLRYVAVFAAANSGRWIAPVATFIQLPLIIMVPLMFRYEYARLIFSTFDFWFHIVNITVWVFGLAVSFHDSRGFLLFACWADCVNAVLLETYFGYKRVVAAFVWLSIGFLLSLYVGVILNLMDKMHYKDLVHSSSTSYSVRDVVTSAMTTTIMLLFRAAHRKRLALRSKSSLSLSVGYRCLLKLSIMVTKPTSTALHLSTKKPLFQLTPIPIPTIINPTDTLAPGVWWLVARMQKWHIVLLYTVGAFGLVFSTVGFLVRDTAPWCTIAGLCFTVTFTSMFQVCQQRKLLRMLFTSFDFIFVWLQVGVTHLCVCDLMSWELERIGSVLSGFLWMHWALTLDTLTPCVRRRLCVSSVFTVIIVLASLGLQILIVFVMDLQNRDIWHTEFFRQTLSVRPSSMLMSRALTLAFWCIRLISRHWSRKDANELYFIYGDVGFDYEEWKASAEAAERLRGRLRRSRQVVPASIALQLPFDNSTCTN